jgi:hypothetical protein
VALISCVSKKLNEKAQAKELYQSPLFKKNLEWALLEKFDKIYILSAKYGLVELTFCIEPYDVTLNNMPIKERKIWAQNILDDLLMEEDLDDTEFTFLAGSRYREFLEKELPFTKVPMEGLQIGKQLQWLTKNIERLKKQVG